MAKYPGSFVKCFKSLLSLWYYRMDKTKTITLRRIDDDDDKGLKFCGHEPLQLLATRAECPQRICVRLGSCFYVVLEKDTLEVLSPVIDPFLSNHCHVVSKIFVSLKFY